MQAFTDANNVGFSFSIISETNKKENEKEKILENETVYQYYMAIFNIMGSFK